MSAWISAARLRTLPLAASNIILGSFLAIYYKSFNITVFILGMITALLLQILSNFANDYGDFKSGADEKRNSTYERALQSGKISPRSMKNVIIILSVLTFLTGIALVLKGEENMGIQGILVFIGIGLCCIFAAITYTIGKKPYGYIGLGDIAVLIFFGLIGVCGIFYLHAHTLYLGVILPAISLGLFSTGVLNVNNIRDIESDRTSGKNTLVVRLGISYARNYHAFLLILGIVLSIVASVIEYHNWMQFIYLITVPFFIRNIYVVYSSSTAVLFDKELRNLALTTFFFSLIFGISLLF